MTRACHFTLWGTFYCFTLLFSLSSHAQTLTVEQQHYLAAQKALDKNQQKHYKTLRSALDKYPLAIYLDYQAKKNDLSQLPGKQAQTIINQWQYSPLYNRARGRYLARVGQKKRWNDFLIISPTAPNNITLQCYFFRAQLAKGNTKIAYTGAKELWLWGKSRPKACDPLFTAWKKDGLITQDLLWSRMLLTFDARQYSLLSYLAKQLTAHPAEAKRLIHVYKQPNRLAKTFITNTPFDPNNHFNEDTLYLGLKKLAKQNITQAMMLFSRYQNEQAFTPEKAHTLQVYLLKRALIREETTLQTDIDTQLLQLTQKQDQAETIHKQTVLQEAFRDKKRNKIYDDLIERRIRWAIKDKDWSNVKRYIEHLSQAKQDNPRWTYWRARLLQRDNAQDPLAQTLLNTLSQQRHFYGYLAAQQQNKPFQLRHQSTQSQPALKAKLNQDPALARIVELMAINNIIDARSEWLMLLNRQSQSMQQEYALFALEKQWFNLGIETSIKAKIWNDMDLRFPYAAQTHFKAAATKQQTNINELRAIARRESAFNPYATSHAGARGYMQLMPATAKLTAKREKVRYKQQSLFDEATNIQLGSAYYCKLKKAFDQNRILAAASYNAGPNKVRKWLRQSQGQLDAVSFIETIPYQETREYVQALLSYRVIYQLKQHQKPDFLSQSEIDFQY
ncbi:transglycosylase SLT domain-containing protein [Shewanella surugensis]|uniref:Transglycosylase SLT domain-containing protein n=1 Tax=Shewanella surugensis TaxID=212020 RepID=A0ABT0LCQ9_9GAMM|nr:transglycosylase SLT domain-containing protein [Shewanella surugensis]MCL1125127.1 transglycosylase SLT domain-containing protein [Shewanella surugensis]